MPLTLTVQQQALAAPPFGRHTFLEGPAGAGKTTAAAARLQGMLAAGVPAGNVLVVVPQRTLAAPYEAAASTGSSAAGGQVTILTIGGLARRMVDLFWPLVAEAACFAAPDCPPTFLTLETAQYYMARLVRPLLDQGYFETVVIDRNRIYSQILDNLNKAAVSGFPPSDIAGRLKMAWTGSDRSQLRIYDEAQDCAMRFREYCLAHNLLDFSLQLEVFVRHLWRRPECREYLFGRYTHLIVDNVEEDTAVAHDLLREWLPACRSALTVYDWDAGYRRFLGADPGNAHTLIDLCDRRVVFEPSLVTSPEIRAVARQLGRALGHAPPQPVSAPAAGPARQLHASQPIEIHSALVFEDHRYYPQMIEWVAGEIAALVEGGVRPSDIAVLSPFLTDALRFLLTNALERHGVAARSHRPSRALREEPATRCLLVLAALGHPSWERCPPAADVAHALAFAIADMDLVRAQLLAGSLYQPEDARRGALALRPFDRLNAETQERVTYRMGQRYDRLRDWLVTYACAAPSDLDHFLARLFGEVLSQTGFGFHRHFEAGQVAANLIESVRKFRWAAGGSLGREYVEMVQDGVVAAQYVHSWQLQLVDAVLLAPAYTFLMANRPVDYQFWLDVGSPGWWERLNQPLTQPYVLSRSWPPGNLWTDNHEHAARQDALYSLVLGLLCRCRRKVYLGLSELGQEGTEQRGPLLRAVNQVFRRSPSGGE
jgi:hypothetical protein